MQDVTGNFSVHNVNGRIEMQNVAGSGTAKTVNGPVKVSFRENPREKSDFATINGNVELYFVRGLAGDFRFKTMNGAVYSDFEMTSLPAQPVSSERHGTKFVFQFGPLYRRPHWLWRAGNQSRKSKWRHTRS